MIVHKFYNLLEQYRVLTALAVGKRAYLSTFLAPTTTF